MTSLCLSVGYIGPKSRTERGRKTKIVKEVAHVTRDSEITFKVKRSKVNLEGGGAYCGGLPQTRTACLERSGCQFTAVDITVTSVVTNSSAIVFNYFSKYCSVYQYLNTN